MRSSGGSTGPAQDAIPVITRGPLAVDRERHTVTWDGQDVHLTAKEFDLLVALLDAHGRVLSRQHLLEEIWGYSYTEGTQDGRCSHPAPAREAARPGPVHRHGEARWATGWPSARRTA